MKKGLSKKNKKGFTLIELVVVIAILGILAAILIPVIGGFIKRANEARDYANARNLYNCVAMVLATQDADDTEKLTDNSKVPNDAVLELFGSIEGDYAAFVIKNGVVDSATYETGAGTTATAAAQTYEREVVS